MIPPQERPPKSAHPEIPRSPPVLRCRSNDHPCHFWPRTSSRNLAPALVISTASRTRLISSRPPPANFRRFATQPSLQPENEIYTPLPHFFPSTFSSHVTAVHLSHLRSSDPAHLTPESCSTPHHRIGERGRKEAGVWGKEDSCVY